jgi:hypothetical protein
MSFREGFMFQAGTFPAWTSLLSQFNTMISWRKLNIQNER